MLSLNKIIITAFKNYELSSFDFSGNVIAVCGLNGKGKTNLLDAIYYCCFTKSYFSSSETSNVNFDQQGFRIEAFFARQGSEQKVVCISRTIKKEISLNDILYEKFSKHIGKLPVVMIAPDDVELITGKSENRRRYIDTLLSQADAGYLQQLITYNKVLQQRNSHLRNMDSSSNDFFTVLEILNEQLSMPGKIIHARRSEFLNQLLPLVQQFYTRITGNTENIMLSYISQLNEAGFEPLLKRFHDKDILLQRSNAGIHKDDISFQLKGQVFRNIASQGQRKSLLFALKLAEFELLKLHKGFTPLLLLDDVFEKLDENRMQQLLQWVCKENNGQVFITDTHKHRLEKAFNVLGVPFQMIEL